MMMNANTETDLTSSAPPEVVDGAQAATADDAPKIDLQAQEQGARNAVKAALDRVRSTASANAEPTSEGADVSETATGASGDVKRTARGKFAPNVPSAPDASAEKLPALDANAVAVPLPASWPKAISDKWTALTPEVQQFLAGQDQQINAEFARRNSDYKQLVETVQSWEPVRGLLSKHDETFQTWGGDTLENIDNCVSFFAKMDVDPVATLLSAAQAYQVPKEILLAALAPDDPMFGNAEAQARLEQERIRRRADSSERQLAVTRQNQAQAQRFRQDEAARYEQQQTAAANDQVMKAMSQALSRNAAAMPHIREVLSVMTPLFHQELDAGYGVDDAMKRSYEAAIYASPTHREKQISARVQAEADKRTAEARKAKAAAQAAMSVNFPDTPSQPADAGSVRNSAVAALARVRANKAAAAA